MKARGTAALLACCLLGTAALAAEPAGAAAPAKGALYVDYDVQAKLRVSKGGHRLDPRSTMRVGRPGCAAAPVRLGSPRRPIRIGAGGRFRLVQRTARFVLRARGRFVTRERVRIAYRSCGSGLARLTAHRTGPIRFRDCRTHRAKTLLRTDTGRVFQQLVWRPGRTGPAGNSWIDAAYGCLFSADEAFALGQDDDDDFDLSSFRLVAPYVAYEQQGCVGLGCGFSVEVRDLRDGRKLRDAPEPSTDSFGKVSDLELKDNGSVAWIADSPPFSPAPVRSVWASDGLGTRRLDEGPDIALGSLRLTGSALSWVNGGVSRSATLE